MSKSGKEGLGRVKEICQDRSQRAKDSKGEGKKIIGYFCCFAPLEIFTAADLVPYRIFGDASEPITRADERLEVEMCPYVRSCLDIALKGRYDFLDGLVTPHSCDAVYCIHRIWKYYIKPSYAHFIQVPHALHPTSGTFLKKELQRFKRSAETYTGSQISDERLVEAIRLHNRNRALLRELNELRKEEPPLISGTEMLETLVSVMSLSVSEANELLSQVINEVKARPEHPRKKPARILIYGGQMDSPAFFQLVEESGANVVMDDLGVGTRFYWYDVDPTVDPLDGLARRYTEKVVCPRIHRLETPEQRFSYLIDFAREFKANGAILISHRFCDTHNIEILDVRDCLRKEGIPALYLEDDYSMISIAPLRTRVEAFLETIG